MEGILQEIGTTSEATKKDSFGTTFKNMLYLGLFSI